MATKRKKYELEIRLPEVTPQQQRAIALLLAGEKQVAIAAEIGISEGTLSRWMNTDCDFIAELNAARLALWQQTNEALLALRQRAIERLETALNSEDEKVAVDVARFILGQAAAVDVRLNPDKIAIGLKNEHELSLADVVLH